MFSLLIAFFMVSIVVSFLCSLWEATLLSITPVYAQTQMQTGSRTGKLLQSFKANVDRPLAAILTLNTIAHTVGAIGVGAQAAVIWSEANPLITSVFVPTVMTLGILILSEIIPKTLGANYWQALAPFTANSLSIVIKALYPLVWMSEQITRTLKSDKERSVFSHAEFIALVEIGVEEGQVEPQQSEIIGNLLQLRSVPVKEVMTPRTVVSSATEELTIREFFNANKKLPYSRIPLYSNGDRDEITGYFLKDTMLDHLLRGRGQDTLETIRRSIIAVPETYPIREMFDRFLDSREQIALVIDEFGGMAGIVTMEDMVETLLGTEIVDEADEVEDLQKAARKKWEKHVEEHGLIQDPEVDPDKDVPEDAGKT